MAFTGLKKFSDWPTYPQIYSNGELVGGLDIVKEMKESDTLDSLLPKQQSLDERYLVWVESNLLFTCTTLRLKGLITKAPVMLFMKGNPEVHRNVQ